MGAEVTVTVDEDGVFCVSRKKIKRSVSPDGKRLTVTQTTSLYLTEAEANKLLHALMDALD